VSHGGWWYWDFEISRSAGQAVVHARSPLAAPTRTLLAQDDGFVYPTPFAFLFAPFDLLRPMAAKLVFLALSISAILLALLCLAFGTTACPGSHCMGAPVAVSLALGTTGPRLILLLAAGWRYRDQARAGVFLALAAAAKLFLRRVLVWLIATHRIRGSAAAAATLGFLALAWVVVHPGGFRNYPRTLWILSACRGRPLWSCQPSLLPPRSRSSWR
jgi:hypothetical protein